MPIQQGWNQATPAMISTFRRGIGPSGTRRRKAVRARGALSKVRVTAKRVRRKARTRLTPVRVKHKYSWQVKGSAAAKAHMKRLRQMARAKRR